MLSVNLNSAPSSAPNSFIDEVFNIVNFSIIDLFTTVIGTVQVFVESFWIVPIVVVSSGPSIFLTSHLTVLLLKVNSNWIGLANGLYPAGVSVSVIVAVKESGLVGCTFENASVPFTQE